MVVEIISNAKLFQVEYDKILLTNGLANLLGSTFLENQPQLVFRIFQFLVFFLRYEVVSQSWEVACGQRKQFGAEEINKIQNEMLWLEQQLQIKRTRPSLFDELAG